MPLRRTESHLVIEDVEMTDSHQARHRCNYLSRLFDTVCYQPLYVTEKAPSQRHIGSRFSARSKYIVNYIAVTTCL
jgi:hypothetical protein